jgi:hypothetical protein
MLLDPDYTQLISQEVSGDAAYESIRFMTQFHRPRGGSDGLWRVAEYVAQRAEAFGLSDVQVIKQASSSRPWNASFADLWIVEPTPIRIASTLQSVLHLADLSRPADVTGELVDLGAGGESDYAGKDLAGKIVLTYGSLSGAMQDAVCEGGALGVIWYPSPFSTDLGTSGAGPARPDQLRWIRAPGQGSDGCEPTFAFGLSLRQGLALRQRLQRTEEPIVMRAVVESAFESEQGTEPWQVMVEAYIRGTEPGLGQDIVLTGHLQEEGFSANDDASGSASVLEVGRALNKLIEEGRIPRPRRNIRMWWVTEIGSQRQYFADHPEAHREMWVNINQDMVGANQAQDVMRKQNITRLPATRFHFFNDVVESVVEYMVAANTYELAQAQAGSALYPKPHTAHLGTLHRFNAEMIFFHTNSDHMTFLEAPIGVPGVSFTNMPDRFIHSSDDDLWNIDRTQLGRNAAAVALISYVMASADGEGAPVINANTVGRGMERMGHNVRLAFSWVAAAQDPEPAYFTRSTRSGMRGNARPWRSTRCGASRPSRTTSSTASCVSWIGGKTRPCGSWKWHTGRPMESDPPSSARPRARPRWSWPSSARPWLPVPPSSSRVAVKCAGCAGSTASWRSRSCAPSTGASRGWRSTAMWLLRRGRRAPTTTGP